ncbi:MAG: SNF2-related protein, partial [Candidatus Omnitrophota bacterium]
MRVAFADGKIELYTHYEERERAKALGAHWDKKRKVWTLDFSKLALYGLRELGPGVLSTATDLDGIEARLDGGGAPCPIKDIVTRPEPPRYDHQAFAEEMLLTRRRLALFMYMGGGKTRTVLDAIQTAFSRKEIRNALIVAPLSVLHVWENEAKKWLMVPFRVIRIAGTMAEKRRAMRDIQTRNVADDKELLIVLVNYDGLIERERRASNDGKPTEKESEPASKERHDFFAGIDWDFVIADESTRLKERRTKTTDAVIKIADKASFVAALTGTPVANTFMDLYAQMRFVDRRCFGTSLARFRERYAVTGGWMGKEITGIRREREDELWKTVRAFSCIVKAEQLNLPKKHNQIRLVTLSGDQLAAYKEA